MKNEETDRVVLTVPEGLRDAVALMFADADEKVLPRERHFAYADRLLADPVVAAALARPRIDVKQDRLARLLWEASHSPDNEADWSTIEGVLRQVYEDRAVALLDAAAALARPTVPEGMTPEQLREIRRGLNWSAYDAHGGILDRWADELAAQIEGGGADDREASGSGAAEPDPAWEPPTLPDDPESVVTDEEAEYLRKPLNERLRQPFSAPAPESSPDGEGEYEVEPLPSDPSDPADRLRWLAGSGYIEAPAIREMVRKWSDEAAAERDALAAKLAALPEVPEGCEVLVVPSETVDWYAREDSYRPPHPDSPLRHVIDAARAAVDRRPVEPLAASTERIDATSALADGRAVNDGNGDFFCPSYARRNLDDSISLVREDGYQAALVAADGTVEVLVEDGE